MWQVTLVTLVVSLGDRLLQKARARYRHLLWVAALAACVALALGSLLRASLRSAQVNVPPSAQTTVPQLQQRLDEKPPMGRITATHAVPGRTIGVWVEVPGVSFDASLALSIVSLYGVLLLCRGGVLLGAWARTHMLLSSARPVELSGTIEAALGRCSRSFNLKFVRIMSSAEVAVPVTAGTTRPVLILPGHLLAESDNHLLVSAIGHEAAHMMCRDYLMNLVYQLCSFPLWFHPAMGLLLRRIRQTRELRCDELVTERLLEPRTYAECLVRLAGAALPFGRPAATITVGIADANILEERVMSILKYSHTAPQPKTMWSTLAILLLAVPSLSAGAFLVHVGVRQPVTTVATDQLEGFRSAPAQRSGSAQQPPRQSRTADRRPSETPAFSAAAPRRRDAVLVIAHRTNNRTPELSELEKPDSHSGFLEERAPQPISAAPGGVAGGVEDGISGGVKEGASDGPGRGAADGVSRGVDGGIVGDPPRRLPPSQSAKPERASLDITEPIRVIKKVPPVYPLVAKTRRLSGSVVVQGTVDKNGRINDLQLISGPPLFREAAFDALKQWVFKPARLNGQPIDQTTTVRIEFGAP
jgi:protein TonB